MAPMEADSFRYEESGHTRVALGKVLFSFRMEFTLSGMSSWQDWNQDTDLVETRMWLRNWNALLGNLVLFCSSLSGYRYPWLPTQCFTRQSLQPNISVLCLLLPVTEYSFPSIWFMVPAALWLLLTVSFSLHAFLFLLPAAKHSLSLPLKLKLPQRRVELVSIQCVIVGDLRNWGLIKEKDMTTEAVTHRSLYWAVLGHGWMRVDVPYGMRLSGGL